MINVTQIIPKDAVPSKDVVQNFFVSSGRIFIEHPFIVLFTFLFFILGFWVFVKSALDNSETSAQNMIGGFGKGLVVFILTFALLIFLDTAELTIRGVFS